MNSNQMGSESMEAIILPCSRLRAVIRSSAGSRQRDRQNGRGSDQLTKREATHSTTGASIT